jgi:hypothetical protein
MKGVIGVSKFLALSFGLEPKRTVFIVSCGSFVGSSHVFMANFASLSTFAAQLTLNSRVLHF